MSHRLGPSANASSQLRERLEAVLDYAKGMKLRSGDNPVLWRGDLEHPPAEAQGGDLSSGLPAADARLGGLPRVGGRQAHPRVRGLVVPHRQRSALFVARTFDPDLMTMWPVSTRVNSPRNDDASLVEAVDLAPQSLV